MTDSKEKVTDSKENGTNSKLLEPPPGIPLGDINLERRESKVRV